MIVINLLYHYSFSKFSSLNHCHEDRIITQHSNVITHSNFPHNVVAHDIGSMVITVHMNIFKIGEKSLANYLSFATVFTVKVFIYMVMRST